MNIGIYSGSFNPVHFGHTGLVRWVVAHTDLDEVWMLVSPNNPLKDSRTLADEQVRLEQVRAAVRDIPRVRVSDFEFSLPRPTYTANTLRALSAAYPEHRFTLIIGEDNLAIFPRWREWQYILSHYRLFVYPRHAAGAQHPVETQQTAVAQPITEAIEPIPDNLRSNIVFLKDAPYFDISGTAIRAQQQTNRYPTDEDTTDNNCV